jgi:hypothetical protein
MGDMLTIHTTGPDLEEAMVWLKAARTNYIDYKKLVRVDWLPFISKVPDNPQDAINLLQQCVEKILKALALASGTYNYEQLMNYRHDSLRLCIDMFIRLIEMPLAQVFLDALQGRIFRQYEAEIYEYNEAIRRLTELKEKSKLESATKEMNELAYKFAILPRESIGSLVNSQIKAIRHAKVGAFLLRLIPMRLLKRSGRNSSKVYSEAINSLNRHGFLLSDRIDAFSKNEGIASLLNTRTEEQRLSLIKHFGDLLVYATVFMALFTLAAITYTHAVSPRYPANPIDLRGGKRKLGSESYTKALGLARSLISVGKLTSVVLKESEREAAFIADIYSFFNNSSHV